MITPYLRDEINDQKAHGKLKVHSSNEVVDYETEGEWKIQLPMEINFVSSKGSDEIRIIHTKSIYNGIHYKDIIMGSETDEIIEELCESLLQKYQEGLKESLKESKFYFDCVNSLYYHLQRISLIRVGSYIDPPELLKNQNATINPENKDDNYFQYALTATLNYKNIKSHPERVSNLKPFVDQYNWKDKFSISSNINEVIRAVFNFLFIYFFLQKDFTSTKKNKNAYSEQI